MKHVSSLAFGRRPYVSPERRRERRQARYVAISGANVALFFTFAAWVAGMADHSNASIVLCFIAMCVLMIAMSAAGEA